MSEGTPISVQVEEKSALVISDYGWQEEQRFRSSQPIFIDGIADGVRSGRLAGHLVVHREVVGDSYQEKLRFARLSRLDVQPDARKKGLGSLLVAELEKLARRFGAAKIIGEISPIDLDKQPNLPAFYEKLGFTLTKEGYGYLFEKHL